MTGSNGHLTSNGHSDWRTDPDLFVELLSKGMDRAVKNAIAEHHLHGDPVAIWRDGQIVWLYPDGSTRPIDEEAPTG